MEWAEVGLRVAVFTLCALVLALILGGVEGRR